MPMLLKGSNGNEFEMGFTRDSFPETQDGFGDSRWTTVTFRASTADESWEETSPAINLFEFTNLADWLEAVGKGSGGGGAASGSPEVSEVELLEPELKFSVSQQGNKDVTLRIGFHLSERPEQFAVDAETDEAEYIDIHLSRASVLAAARTLRAQLEELQQPMGKDDLLGAQNAGAMGEPDEDLNLVDRIVHEPPGAGFGEDNAGNR